MTQPVDGRGLGDPSVTVLHASKVVSDKYPTGFAVETNAVLATWGSFDLVPEKEKLMERPW